MPALAWSKRVPDAVDPPALVPLDWDTYLQQHVPVLIASVLTTPGGVEVELPAAFTAEIASAAEYRVALSKETFDPRGGEPFIDRKTTGGFFVRTAGDEVGEDITVTVFWKPA